ncbi:LacI family DNA-binding transcriptional regulator [Reichenbachiella ulvae]|uniref:LacI family transcriptional regulator n=1 Tax=Reichenbachiella ulvae TaxID=2980104 RepID=A0ABT3D0C7_9BACT|nr:LacI family DNA-binding transcriptional regulator [Reichenbachiella ulvae]MCV9389412.1 LacI family transcriptional regulator [Reichenbachiella ulvae]
MKRITIKEIAKRAGVSVGTVDRVLHNRGEVAEATKKEVLRIAKEGNYTTNVFARSLKLNQVHKIAVILPLDNEYWQTQQSGIQEAAEEYESLGLQLKFFPFDRSNQGSFLSKAAMAIEDQPDAVILAPLMEEEATDICSQLGKLKIPFVFVDSNLERLSPLAFIGQDSVQSGYLAAKLLTYGLWEGPEVFVLKYADFDSLNKTIDERLEGFKSFYKEKKWKTDLIKEVNVKKEFDPDEIFDKDSALVFVPNSRAHQIAKRLALKAGDKQFRIVGYDLIRENAEALDSGRVDFILDQNPKLQGQQGIQAIYKKLIVNTEVKQYQFMPLEVVTKENLKYANSYDGLGTKKAE